jgi:hypothetical protein
MPGALAPWIDDVATRLQCPPDYVGVAAITALGSVIGRRIGIKPQRKTDWVEVPNLWGLFIGRPGMLKSPAMMEALKPIHRLEAEAAKDNEVAWLAYAAAMDIFKVKKQVADQLAKKQLKKDAGAPVDFGLGPEPEEPRTVRFRTNDTTYEGLGELLIANPSGVLIERDELISLLKHLDRDDQAVARGFYLSGWSGEDGGPVSREAIVRALAFASYLESHARRVYRSSSEGELAAAKAILARIRAGDLNEGFTARDVHQHDWAHLTERDQVGAGLNLLVELGHLADLAAPSGPQGSRPKVTYRINPRGVR